MRPNDIQVVREALHNSYPGPGDCQDDAALAFERVAAQATERDAFRAGMLALLGAQDFRTEYECEHGTPLGRKCQKSCHLNPTRNAIALLP